MSSPGPARDSLAGKLPVSLITGFLGSGKTTLLKRLLRDPGMNRAAVIINEFGEVGIDHELLASSSESMTLLSNGCLCCTLRTDLQETLRELFIKRRAGEVIDFDRVLVEMTGLADPIPVLHTLRTDGLLGAQYRLNGIVTLVDAVNGIGQLDTMPEAVKQAAVADRIVITKIDVADDETVARLQERLRAMNPFAHQTIAVAGIGNRVHCAQHHARIDRGLVRGGGSARVRYKGGVTMASRDRVGVIGLGIMGSAMSRNIIGAGFPVTGYDVLAARRTALSKTGGQAARNVRDVATTVPIVITSLPSADALQSVAADIADAHYRNQIVIETSTLPIATKENARKLLAEQGVTLLDCPLSGTGAQAKVKDLAVYASGVRNAYRRCIPIFEAFARTHYFLGSFGAGSKMKFVANLLVAIHNVSTAEPLVLGMKAGLDPATLVKVLGDGAGGSRMLQTRGPMMVRNDYADR